MSIPALLQELGADFETVARGTGLDISQFLDPDQKLPFLQASRLLARCVEITRLEDFGLMLGERTAPSSLGLAGFILPFAPDLRTALQGLMTFLDLHDQGGHVFLSEDNDIAIFGYDLHIPDVLATGVIYDLSITLAFKIVASLCGEAWYPTGIYFTKPKPPNLSKYHQIFDAAIHFNADENALHFPAYWLSQELRTSNPPLFRHLMREAEILHSFETVELLEKVQRILEASIGKQKCDANSVARRCGMHERTLHRRLQERGTTFQQELDRVRFDHARLLLKNRHMPLVKIAELLHYADTTTFIRAFKRWSGKTPAHWRKVNTA